MPDCDECEAWKENPADFVLSEICPDCVHNQEINNPIIFKLLRYHAMIEAGCPVERHELRNSEWIMLGIIRAEFEKAAAREIEQKTRDCKKSVHR